MVYFKKTESTYKYKSPMQIKVPVSKTVTDDQLLCLKHWHEAQFERLNADQTGSRDNDSIRRSASVLNQVEEIQISRSRELIANSITKKPRKKVDHVVS